MKQHFIMKNIRFLLGGVLLAVTVQLSAQARAVDEAVFEKISKTFILNDDGSQECHYYKKIRYNTHHSFHNLTAKRLSPIILIIKR